MEDDKIKNEITEEEAKEEIEKGRVEATKLLENPDKLEEFLQKLERKMKKIPAVGNTFSLVPAMISLVRSYAKKEYTVVPLGTIVGIVSALIYIFSPIDLIPDPIPVVGLTDDAAVLLTFLRAGAKSDIEDYKKWRENNNKSIQE